MLKKYDLPDEFEAIPEWVKLGTEFRHLVEPLDIANFYRHAKGEDTGVYMKRGRPKRYKSHKDGSSTKKNWQQVPGGSPAFGQSWRKLHKLSGDLPAVTKEKGEGH
uniref:Lipoxygenase-non-heme Fe(Ii) metalloprotein n=1 Tax=Pyrus pyrifolia TaxID=3767 RepID=Q9LLJ9_PYRPY|nr:lipoxygenase-non-heme Fe(Ii) metalloprotein [Pyrus pyrifolia]